MNRGRGQREADFSIRVDLRFTGKSKKNINSSRVVRFYSIVIFATSRIE